MTVAEARQLAASARHLIMETLEEAGGTLEAQDLIRRVRKDHADLNEQVVLSALWNLASRGAVRITWDAEVESPVAEAG